MGRCLFQGTDRCGLRMVNDLNLFGWFLCPTSPEHLWNIFISLDFQLPSYTIHCINDICAHIYLIVSTSKKKRLITCRYGQVSGSICHVLSTLETSHPQLKAVCMGTRRTDLYYSDLQPFSPTDGGWPDYLRINCILVSYKRQD